MSKNLKNQIDGLMHTVHYLLHIIEIHLPQLPPEDRKLIKSLRTDIKDVVDSEIGMKNLQHNVQRMINQASKD